MLKITTFRLASFTFAILVITLPLQWFEIIAIGPLALKPVHISFSLIVFTYLLFPGVFKSAWRTLKYYRFFFVSYSVYLILMYLAVFNSESMPVALAMNTKNLIYFLYCISLIGLLHIISDENDQFQMSSFVVISVVTFLIICVYVFQQLERSFFLEYGLALINGDIKELMFGFYKPIFNYSFGSGAIDPDSDQGTSLRNTLVGSFILFVAILASELKNRKGSALVVSRITISILILLIIASVSRSNYLTLIMISIVVFIAGFKFKRTIKINYLPLLPLVFIGLIASIILALPYIIPVINILIERTKEIAESGRIDMYNSTITLINKNYLIGYGTGARLGAFHDLQVHNLFLGAWYQAGILGLISAVAYYLALVIFFLNTIFRYLLGQIHDHRKLWLIAIIILPLFRALVSGNSGNFTMIEWTCLAVFFTVNSKLKYEFPKN